MRRPASDLRHQSSKVRTRFSASSSCIAFSAASPDDAAARCGYWYSAGCGCHFHDWPGPRGSRAPLSSGNVASSISGAGSFANVPAGGPDDDEDGGGSPADARGAFECLQLPLPLAPALLLFCLSAFGTGGEARTGGFSRTGAMLYVVEVNAEDADGADLGFTMSLFALVVDIEVGDTAV